MQRILVIAVTILTNIYLFGTNPTVTVDLLAYELGYDDSRGVYLLVYGNQGYDESTFTCFRNDNPQFFDSYFSFVKQIKQKKNRWVITETRNVKNMNYNLSGWNTFYSENSSTYYYKRVTPNIYGYTDTRKWQNTVTLMDLTIDTSDLTIHKVVGFKSGGTFTRTFNENNTKTMTSSATTTGYHSRRYGSTGTPTISRPVLSSHNHTRNMTSYTCTSSDFIPIKIGYDVQGLYVTHNLGDTDEITFNQRQNPYFFSYLVRELQEIKSMQSDTLKYQGGQSISSSTINSSSGPRRRYSSSYYYEDYTTTVNNNSTTSRGYPNPSEGVAPKYDIFYEGPYLRVIRYADDVYRTLAENCDISSSELPYSSTPQAPRITLLGDNPVNLDYGASYVEPGYTTWDINRDTVSVTVEYYDNNNNLLPSGIPSIGTGVFKIKYTASDGILVTEIFRDLIIGWLAPTALPPKYIVISGLPEMTHVGKYEVTYALWMEVRDWALNNGYPDIGLGNVKGYSLESDKLNKPIAYVSLYSIVKWCNAYSEMMGRQPVYLNNDGTVCRSGHYNTVINSPDYTKNGFRLPTHTEWIYCYRAGTTTDFYWGNNSDSATISLYTWNANNSGDVSHDVGIKLPNAWDICDIAGNVREYTISKCNGDDQEYYRDVGGSFDVFAADYFKWNSGRYLCEDGDGGQDHFGFRVVYNDYVRN
jgi:hypothetical protein